MRGGWRSGDRAITAEDFGVLCDVVERAWNHWPIDPDEGEPKHTSGYARAAAQRIVNELGLVLPPLDPEHLRRMADNDANDLSDEERERLRRQAEQVEHRGPRGRG